MFQSIIEALQANVVIVGLLVGAITPLVVSLVQQPKWSKRTRQGVAIAAAVVVGFAVAASGGQLANPGDLLSVIVAVWAAGEAFYQKVWKASGIAGAVERATSPVPADDELDYDSLLEDPDPYDFDYGPEPDGLETK